MNSEFRATMGAAAGIVAVYLCGFVAPGSLNWGFHFLGFLPWYYVVLYLAGALWIALFIVRGHPEELIVRPARMFSESPFKILLGTLVALISFAFLLRVQAPLLGDSLYLLKNYVEASKGISPLYPRDEPLATYYFSTILNLLGPSTFKEYLRAFLGADILLGIGFVVNIMLIAKNLWNNPTHQLLAFVFLLVLPYTQLFLGYVETYPVVLFTLSLYLCLTFAYFNDKRFFFFVPSAFLIMALSHYLSGLLVGSLIYTSIIAYRKRHVNQVVIGYSIAGLALVFLFTIVGFDIQRFSSWVPYSHFLSISESLDPLVNYAQAYTLFSPYHAIDLANLLLLLVPFPIFMIIMRLSRRDLKEPPSPQRIFLMIALVPIVCFLVVVKFDLGAARDWDVFSPYSLLAGVLAALLFFSREEPMTVRTCSAIILLTLLNSLFFFYVNSNIPASLKRYMSFFDRRTLSQNGYYGATLQLAMYYRETRMNSEPLKIWETYVEAFPDDDRGYQNIINNLSQEKNEADILGVYEKWYARDPENVDMQSDFKRFAIIAGNRNFASGNLEQAESYYTAALRLDPDDPRACNNLGSVLAERKEFDKAIEFFARAISIDTLYADALHNIGNAYIDSGTKERGIDFLRRAARLGHSEARKELAQLKLSW